MSSSELLNNEIERIRAMYDLGILNTPIDDDYCSIIDLAILICGTQVALITFVDRERQ